MEPLFRLDSTLFGPLFEFLQHAQRESFDDPDQYLFGGKGVDDLFNTNAMDWRVVSQYLLRKCLGNELPW
jgi:hypothetical protein